MTIDLGEQYVGAKPKALEVQFVEKVNDIDVPIPLTGYTATFISVPGGTRTATVSDAPAGKVTYQWVEGDLAVAGWMFAQIWVTNGPTKIPSEEIVLRVKPAL